MALWTIKKTEDGGYTVLYDRKDKPTQSYGEVRTPSLKTLRDLEAWVISESQSGDLLRVEGREYAMPMYVRGRDEARA